MDRRAQRARSASSADYAFPVSASLTDAAAPSPRSASEPSSAPAPAVGPRPLHPLLASSVALAAGIAVWLAFPGHGLWPLAPVGVGLLALAVRGQRARRAGWLGLLAGMASFVPLLAWSGIYVGKLPWFALATLESLYVAVMAGLMPGVWRLAGTRWAPLVVPAGIGGLWVAQEAVRGRVPFGGFPWARIAFSQSESPLLSLASLGGAPAVTAAVAVLGGCLAVAVTHLPRPGRTAATTLLLGAVVLAGAAVLPRPTGGDRTVQIAAVQGNVPKPGLDFNAERRAVLDNHAQGTQALARQVREGDAPAPALVVWPENSSDIDPTRNPDAAQVIQAATDAIGVPVVVGSVLAEPVDHLSNASIVWGPSSGPAPGPGVRYIKRHPAPFAEYIPYRSFFRHFSDKVDLVRRDFVAGTGSGAIDAAGIRIGDIICFEVAYDDHVRETVRSGGQLLVVQTNNATFGFSDESIQQLAMSRLRAVEAGRAVVHISTVGVSAMISPDGAVMQRSGHFTAEVLQAAMPLRTTQTVSTRVGAWPEAALAAAGLLIAMAGTTRRRRGQR